MQNLKERCTMTEDEQTCMQTHALTKTPKTHASARTRTRSGHTYTHTHTHTHTYTDAVRQAVAEATRVDFIWRQGLAYTTQHTHRRAHTTLPHVLRV